jgi:hypothetical protein
MRLLRLRDLGPSCPSRPFPLREGAPHLLFLTVGKQESLVDDGETGASDGAAHNYRDGVPGAGYVCPPAWLRYLRVVNSDYRLRRGRSKITSAAVRRSRQASFAAMSAAVPRNQTVLGGRVCRGSAEPDRPFGRVYRGHRVGTVRAMRETPSNRRTPAHARDPKVDGTWQCANQTLVAAAGLDVG